jgi:hypothetical protein
MAGAAGCAFSFPARVVQGLDAASEGRLTSVALSGPRAGVFGPQRCMNERARRGTVAIAREGRGGPAQRSQAGGGPRETANV